MKENENQPSSFSKRRFVQGLSFIIGGTAASSLLSGNAFAHAISYQKSNDKLIREGKVLNSAEMAQLKKIAELIIPKTDTPSAADVDCHGFADNQLFHCYDKVQHQRIKKLLRKIALSSDDRFQIPFLKLKENLQYRLLNNVEQAKQEFLPEHRSDFKFLKYLIVFGYYTSEVGATQELSYQAVPGGYKGSVPYSEIGKGWGSLAYY
ncbi:gluconate 2-dehydrogenase subunit 3 family protein [Aliikangiella coralliicola]|uniref:Gluconate 2-dehydrogenase subunit 3 family protein n=1 Tax=Aliikangiella coralliicola TaxID=2592383 RepID=A0A545U4G0_9GAMM|nr:gluconate 2-dehydrogenase subunit 3 family protein [Aliikangiella coralliicola]TQV84367.1 gluconate 2-dehydrogenase subunit 3 family protein [Aliikangiella coralliicola]